MVKTLEILKIIFSRTKKLLRLNLNIYHGGLKLFQVCSNGEHRLTFDLFKASSNFLSIDLYGGMLKIIFFNMYLRLMAETYNVF